jgi:hypothetical protein
MSELFIVIVAIAIAMLMTIKPEMFVLNKSHGPKFVKSIRYIGMSVAIVLLAMMAAEYIF